MKKILLLCQLSQSQIICTLYVRINQHPNGCSGFCAALATGQSVCTKHEKEENQIKPMNCPVSLERISCINRGLIPILRCVMGSTYLPAYLLPQACTFLRKGGISISRGSIECCFMYETNHTVVLQHASHFCTSDSKFLSIFSSFKYTVVSHVMSCGPQMCR